VTAANDLAGRRIVGGVYGAMALTALAHNVRGNVIAGAGHWIAEEQPAALTACLIDFLQGG
jgi:pimeloyl-ACP methyl ester carboxylesterase